MDISRGFQIEYPRVFIPWKISEAELLQVLDGHPSRLVTHGYITTHCISLDGLPHELGFHFHPREGGTLIEFEFFRTSYTDHTGSFQEFQQHLETKFGQPTNTSLGSVGFPSHSWCLPGAEVVHYVYDRFGPEEHVRIKKR